MFVLQNKGKFPSETKQAHVEPVSKGTFYTK